MAWRAHLTGLATVVLLSCGTTTGTAAREEITVFSGSRPSIAWIEAVGERDAALDEIDGISVTDDGTTIIAGVFRGSIDLAGETYSSRGEGDVFLASIGVDGRQRWAKRFGGPGDDNAFDVTTDGAGNIILSGWFADSVDFGGQTLVSRGDQDQFLAKYAPDGSLIWARRFGGPQGDGGNEVAVTPGGEIAVSAITAGDFEVDGQVYPFGGGRRDSLVLRLSPEGQVRWVVPAGGPGLERIRALSMTPSGDVYVGFQFRGQLDMAGRTLAGAGRWDGAFARLTPSGDLAWLLPMASRGIDGVRGVGATDDGNVYASGIVGGGGGSLAGRSVQGFGRDTDFVLKVTPDGQPIWLLTLAGSGRTNNGGEIIVNEAGVIVSTLMTGEVTVRRDSEVVAMLEPRGSGTTSLLMGFDHGGTPRFAFRPEPGGASGAALGDVLSVSPNGRYLAQALRFRDRLNVAGTELSTPAERDSAAILLRLDGP